MEQPRHGVYAFGEYRLDTVTRAVTRGGVAIKLGARLFDALLYLVEHEGRLVSQEDLERAIWPGRQMERGNLARAISSLRTALKADGADEQIIITLAGRGYRLGALVTFAEHPQPGAQEAAADGGPPDIAAYAAAPADPRRRLLTGLPGSAVAGAAAVLGMAALLAMGLDLARQRDVRPWAAPPNSIAVLPFANISGDAQQDYLSDGMTDELISSLGDIGPLRVVARASSFSFKGKTTDIHAAALALNVASILDGTVRRQGRTIVVTAELIDTKTGYRSWSHRYEFDERDFLPVERQIFSSTLGALKIADGPDVSSKVATGGTTNPEAFDAYMRAIGILRNGEIGIFEPANEAFNRAIGLDPHFAMAFAQRARLLVRHDHLKQAVADAERAVALAPELGFAHSTLGRVLGFTLTDFTRAKAEFTRALELSPRDAVARLDYGLFEVCMGQFDQGLASGRQAIELDPLTTATHIRFANMAALSGRFEDALAAVQHASLLTGDHQELQRETLGTIETWSGDAKSALKTCSASRVWGDRLCLAIAYHRLGDQGHADEAMARLRSELGDGGAYNFAEVYAVWGRQSEALQWLRRAFDAKDPGLFFLRVDPLLASLHSAPDYAGLQSQLGFPPPHE